MVKVPFWLSGVIITMKNNFLFITEKWCDGLPEKGLTNNFHNLFSTFKKANPQIKFNVVHLDEVALKLKTHLDNVIADVYKKTKPEYVIFSLLGNSHLNPTIKTFQFLKSKNVKMIFMWADVSSMYGQKEIEHDLVDYTDLHVCWGSEKNVNTKTKTLWLFAPQDESLYYPDNQNIDVSFIGSLRYLERQQSLQYLINKGTKININGGQREAGLTPQIYSMLIRNSKINLNFAQGPNGVFQCKGRVWEILASKSLLIEKINNATTLHLTPGMHYVAYDDLDDLNRKIRYYLINNEERNIITQNGYNLYKEKFTYRHFWDTVLNSI